MSLNKIKKLGQVYTPEKIVNDILNVIDYKGEKILRKHIIDNSCGNGAFLKVIVNRYIVEYEKKHGNLLGVKKELETFIHGIEIDKIEYVKCLNNLSQNVFWKGIVDVNWNVLNADAIETHNFDCKMDYVVGNPPYIRIHNLLDNFRKIRKFKFSKSGMADMYILFYEIGFNMLKKTGKLCYITPNSFYSSMAGLDFRKFIINTRHLYSLIDLGHYQPFKTTTYTTICAFDFSKKFDTFDFYKYNKDGKIIFEEELDLKEAFNKGKMILAKKHEQEFLTDIQNYVPIKPNEVVVKNGFATLCDKVFISSSFNFNKNTIKVIKASTGEWKKMIYPYNAEGKIISFKNLSNKVKTFLKDNRKDLENRSIEKNGAWYSFGRSQAIKDVFKNKFAINTTIKDIKSIKLNKVKTGQGVYSGLYIITTLSKRNLEKILLSEDFIDYVRILGKCKSGGYYTFSSKELQQYILYKKEKNNG